MKKLIEVGDEFRREFIEHKTVGMRPICVIEGKIAFIHKHSTNFVKPESIWIVQVYEIREKYLIVLPLVQVETQRANIEAKRKTLFDNFHKDKTRKPKQHKNYPFMSNYEMKTVVH